MALSPKVIATIKATVPALEAHGFTLTTHFYKKMLAGNPEVKEFFNPAHNVSGAQPAALANAVLAYAKNIDNLGALGEAVELIAQKHCSLAVKAEHYPIVGKHLLASIKDVMGDAATPDVMDAWAQAYGLLADVLIGREKAIYDEQKQDHGWVGVKEFVVVSKEEEGDVATSFHLKPKDGMKLRAFKPGTYLTIRAPGTWFPTTMRNYSISNASGGDTYRITVERQDGAPKEGVPKGCVSTWLREKVQVGDTVELLPPCGHFVDKACSVVDAAVASGCPVVGAAAMAEPYVFLAGGTGITGLLPMAEAAAAKGRKVFFMYGVRMPTHLMFKKDLKALAAGFGGKAKVVLSCNEGDKGAAPKGFDAAGNLDAKLVKEHVQTTKAHFFLCGPEGYLRNMYNGLIAWGVEPARIHYKNFGPLIDLSAPPVTAAS